MRVIEYLDRFARKFMSLYAIVMKHIVIARWVWKDRKSLDSGTRTSEEAEFLPEALSLQETPPSPYPRMGAWILTSFVFFAFLYCVFAKVDVVVVGDGKIVEKSYSRVLSATTTARLLRFRFSEGDTVARGQIVADLDEEFAAAEVERLQRQLEDAKLENLRSRWILTVLESGKQKMPIRDTSIDKKSWESGILLMSGTLATIESESRYRNSLIAQKNAELSTANQFKKKIENSIVITREKEQDVARLASEKILSRHDALTQRQDLSDKEGEIEIQAKKINEISAAIKTVEDEQLNANAKIRKDLLESARNSSDKISQLEKEVVKAKTLQSGCHLVSPIDGTVQQLSSQLVGGVAMPGNQILVVVPLKRQFKIDGKILNQDVGFVLPGMNTNIKIAAFPYTKYGTIPGKITHVSNDALPDEKNGLIFMAQSSLERDYIQLENKRVNLSPGLQVSIEIRTGERRLIEYFLGPLIQKTTESFRER